MWSDKGKLASCRLYLLGDIVFSLQSWISCAILKKSGKFRGWLFAFPIRFYYQWDGKTISRMDQSRMRMLYMRK